MTSRERILAAMKFEQVDRLPVSPLGFGKLEWGSPLCMELLRRTDPYIDVGAHPDTEWILGGNAEVEHKQSGRSTTTIIHTPKGDLTCTWTRTEITSAVTEHLFKDFRDVEKLLSIPYEPAPLDLSLYHTWCERLGEDGLVLGHLPNGIGYVAYWFSPEDFCLAWADDPDLIERLTAILTERWIDYVNRCCEAGVPGFRVLGGEYATVQLGPKGFKRLCVPYDRKLIEAIHDHGAVAHYHNHGSVANCLLDFAEIGMDSLDPLEAPPWGDVDLKEARRTLGERICFVGNLDDMEVIDKLPTEEILVIARERIDAAGERGFILSGTSSGTYGEQGAKNFIAMAEIVGA
ncbi:MAG: hypothetical protein M1133_14795 [Armatimonadetes bacterium]|nr:hypothetical protein [Armatimonadota bacterium]